MAHKTFIPKRFFSKCKISKRTSKWINSELVEVDESKEFEGAVFNLNRQDIKMLTEQGIQITLDSKKIYCYIDIGLKNAIEFEGNKNVSSKKLRNKGFKNTKQKYKNSCIIKEVA